jgi:hypothetical protein
VTQHRQQDLSGVLSVECFLRDGFALRQQLAAHLALSPEQLEQRLPHGTAELAALHPGGFDPEQVGRFYEETVGTAHLLELAAWHLDSADYIADTLRLQQRFARGQVLDFGGGIGSHALAAAGLEGVDQVWFVDLNPHNRGFVAARAEQLASCGKTALRPRSPGSSPARAVRHGGVSRCAGAPQRSGGAAGGVCRAHGPRRRGPAQLVFLQGTPR